MLEGKMTDNLPPTDDDQQRGLDDLVAVVARALRAAYRRGYKDAEIVVAPLYRSDAKVVRNADICARFDAGETATAIGESLGLSRERVCQVLRKENKIAMRDERAKLAREVLAADKETLRAAADELAARNLAAAKAMVAGGVSLTAATARYNIPSNTLGVACRAAGIEVTTGKWRDFSARKQRVRELHAAGFTQAKVIATMKAEGERVSSSWLSRHMRDLVWQSANRKKDGGQNV